jgi:hypothetical protein
MQSCHRHLIDASAAILPAKVLLVPLDRETGGFQCPSGHTGKEENKHSSFSESNPCHLVFKQSLH